MSDLRGISILVFCPQFFGYDSEIFNSLNSMGAKVVGFDDRPSNSFISKVLIRLDKRFLKIKIERYYRKIMFQLVKNQSKFDYVLFVNPESVTKNILSVYKIQFTNAKFIMYMWDSFNNRKNSIELISLFDSKFTFDYNDAKRYNLIFRPLFYLDIYKAQIRPILYNLLFIGTAHSNRYDFVQKTKELLKSNFKFKTYFYLDSKLLFLLKKIIEKDFRKVPYSEISFKSLTHYENADLLHQSSVILDINHPKQVGLTMRTLEAMGAQKKLITTNANIVNYDFYNEKNVFIIDREKPEIDPQFFEGSFVPYSPEILFKYSIKGWIYTLINLS